MTRTTTKENVVITGVVFSIALLMIGYGIPTMQDPDWLASQCTVMSATNRMVILNVTVTRPTEFMRDEDRCRVITVIYFPYEKVVNRSYPCWLPTMKYRFAYDVTFENPRISRFPWASFIFGLGIFLMFYPFIMVLVFLAECCCVDVCQIGGEIASPPSTPLR